MLTTEGGADIKMVAVFTGVILFILRALPVSFHGRGGPNAAQVDQGMNLTPKDPLKHDSPRESKRGPKSIRHSSHFIFMTEAKNYRSA